MFQSLRRGFPRIFVLALLGTLILWVTRDDDLALILGAFLTPTLDGFGRTLLAFAAADVALRILQPYVDSQDAAREALRDRNIAAGYVYLGRNILIAVVLLLFAGASSRAAEPPKAAEQWLPILKLEQATHWRDHPMPSVLGAQIEQETCLSLTHRMCWSPRAELKTSREWGVNFGQFTKAFNAAGIVRFDALSDIVRDYPKELAGFSWSNPYDARLGLRALVLKDRQTYLRVKDAATEADRLQMAASAYNGGDGGLLSDRNACRGTPGCNPGRWFGNVEKTSFKAKVVVPGYGKPFYAINREYVTNIFGPRRPRYLVLDQT